MNNCSYIFQFLFLLITELCQKLVTVAKKENIYMECTISKMFWISSYFQKLLELWFIHVQNKLNWMNLFVRWLIKYWFQIFIAQLVAWRSFLILWKYFDRMFIGLINRSKEIRKSIKVPEIDAIVRA